MTTRLTATDAALSVREQIYVTGGVVPSWPLPACDDLVVYKNRVFGIQSEDKKALVFTQFLQDGEVPQWHPFLVQRLDDDGPCVGLAVMDDNLIIFKADAIWAMRGNGPDRKGLNSDYILSKINTPHGCIDRRSIVADARGIAFRSRLGIQRLTRKFEVEYFGVKVEDELVDSDEINCAVALPNYVERLYFLIAGANNDSRILVYQWGNDQWAEDIIPGNEDSNAIPRHMVWLNGLAYAVFTSDSHVYAHTGDEDPQAIITLVVGTQWIKFAGQQGFKRIRNIEILGEYRDEHNIRFDLFRDYDDQTIVQTVLFDTTTVTPLTIFGVLNREQLKIHVKEQRCQALKFFMTVTPTPSDSFHSDVAAFVGMAFDVGIKPTLMRLPNVALRG